MRKKVVAVCIMSIVIFGFLSYRFSIHQREAEGNCLAFLYDCEVDVEKIKKLGPLLDRGVSAFVDRNVGEWNIQRRQELWDRYRHYAYWGGVCRGLVEAALVVLVILGFRALFSRIYVSKGFYHKFWRAPDSQKKDEKDSDSDQEQV
jgi:hypothetical protein